MIKIGDTMRLLTSAIVSGERAERDAEFTVVAAIDEKSKALQVVGGEAIALVNRGAAEVVAPAKAKPAREAS